MAGRRNRLGTLFIGLLLLACSLLQAAWAQTCAPGIVEVHMAKEPSGTTGPPAQGWDRVTLPDDWSTRWPDYSGVGWYRFKLSEDCVAPGKEPVALLVTSINMAGEVYLNDTLLWRDASLQAPLTRSWNMPRYWILPETAMHATDNVIWIRVQGEALVHPGVGVVRVGPQAQILAQFERSQWNTRTIFLINLIGTLFIAGLFAGIWLLYRKQSVHGWFALLNLAWALFIYNVVATDPWPFTEVASVVRAIVQAEHSADAQGHAEAARHVSTLKSLRDDLRNVMDGGRTATADTPATPAEWMARTRHRFSTLFDELDVTSHWSCLPEWPEPPSVAACLELTRLLEEALSNVLKHSAATEVDIRLDADVHGALTLEVRDNGVGFDIAAVSHEASGIGLSSMQARIARLGGHLHLESRPGRSVVRASLGREPAFRAE